MAAPAAKKKVSADPVAGAARAAFEQGLGMGWGDEAEAWLRSQAGEGKYEDILKQLQQEYAQYSEDNPWTSGVMEFTGGMLPGVAAMFVPGAQGAGAQQIARTTTGTLAKLAASPLARAMATGAVTGGVTGAGTSEPGDRLSGAAGGTLLGGILGFGTPVGLRVAGGGLRWLRERILPTDASTRNEALRKISGALQESGLTPQDITTRTDADRALNVPSVIANVDPALADLAEAVAQRTGSGTRKVEEKLTAQRAGSRERVQQQTVKGLQPGDYYAQEEALTKSLRSNANDLYQKAYDVGTVDDPVINEILKDPKFQSFFEEARDIANTEKLGAKLRGEDTSKYELKDLYKIDSTGKLTHVELPDVRTLDYIKRGIDALIDAGYKGQRGLSAAKSNALKPVRNEFVARIDNLVPEYKAARGKFAGEMEVIDALRAGKDEFGKLDHEQIAKMVAGMSDAEKDAFRTGVSRDLYSRIMDPSSNFNSAQRIIGSPEMQKKLRPLFSTEADFNLFKSALERESQLFFQANKILGGSGTAKRTKMAEKLDEGQPLFEAAADAVMGGPARSLSNLVARVVRWGQMPEETADKMAKMLMSSDPHEVAAVVQMLEEYANRAVPMTAAKRAAESAGTTGATISIFSPPQTGEEPDLKEDFKRKPAEIEGPDLAADYEKFLKEEEAKKKSTRK